MKEKEKKKRRKIRVVMLIDAWFPFLGGGQEHVLKISQQLSKQCDFSIYHATSSSKIKRAFWSFTVIPQVILMHKKKRFDLIHAHAFIAGLPGFILSKLLRIPIIYTVHGSHSLDLYEMEKKNPDLKIEISKFKYLFEKFLLTGIKYDHQISVSSNFLLYRNVNKKISIISNGIDLQEFSNIKTKKRKEFTIIFVGRDDYIKGISYLNKAMKTVKKGIPNIKLIKIIGNISNRKKLIKAYKSSHLFVLPSLAEGQPISLLEAWAAKLPVVVTSVGDNPNMVTSGINGYLVPPADEKALSKSLLQALNNPKLEELGQSGYNLVRNRYTWKKVVNKTLKIYKKVLNGS